jgi:hypothetical protein
MYESGVTIGQGNGDTSGQHGPLARAEDDVNRRHNVRAGVARQRVGGQRRLRIQSLDEHLQAVTRGADWRGRHGAQRYPWRRERASRRAAMSARGRARRTRGSGRVNGTTAPVRYRERLRPPWWWYPIGILVAGLLAGEFHISGLPLTDWIPFGVLIPVAILIIFALGRAELAITSDELRIRGAHVPLRFVSGAVALDANTLRRVVGREGDPQAFVSIRPWIGPGVQVWLADADDPTPYWVISTRQPAQVVALLREPIS